MDNDTIKGRRLTNAESMHLLYPDYYYVDDKIINEVCKPFFSKKYKKKLRKNKQIIKNPNRYRLMIFNENDEFIKEYERLCNLYFKAKKYRIKNKISKQVDILMSNSNFYKRWYGDDIK